MKYRGLLITITCMIAGTIAAMAGVPQTINYQGYLRNTDGTPVSVATSVRFSLYSSNPARNNPVWRETKNVTPLGGIYSTQFGSVTPITAPFDVPYYLGIKVAGDAEMALQQLSSAPYAKRASVADSVSTTSQIVSTVATGTPPLQVSSTTQVNNLNADMLDGQHSTYFLNAANLSSGILPSDRVSGSYTNITGVGTLSSLAVSGNASIGGALSFTTPKTSYYNVSHATFFPFDSINFIYRGNSSSRYLALPGAGTASNYLIANISLPHAAIMETLGCRVGDAALNLYDVSVDLVKTVGNSSVTVCGPVISSGAGGNQTLSATCTPADATIDNINSSYVVRYLSSTGCGGACVIHFCTITYTVSGLP